MLPIVDITRFTFQDYPNYTACIIWFSGCNFRCPYCHNPEFILNKDLKILDEDIVFKFLNSRIGLLDGVVLSGGECLLSNKIYNFAKKIKDLGFLLKIDTNGTNFELIKKFIDEKNVDYIALDYKAPKYKFNSITNTDLFDIFDKSLNYVIQSNIDMEIRTTVHTDLLNEDDINHIINDLENRNYKKNYYIQNFKNYKNHTLGNLQEQKREIDKNLIKNKNIKVFYRNFA